MSLPRRKDRKPLNQVAGTATVPTTTEDLTNRVERLATEPTRDEIGRRAYQRFEERGGEPGRDWEDWFRAEREL